MTLQESKQVVVTGAYGFIGSNLVRALNTAGYTKLILVDRFSTDGRWRNMRGIQFEALMDPDEFLMRAREICEEKPTVIFHLGACSDTQEEDEEYVFENNFSYTTELQRAVDPTGALLVYASSAATYGGLEGLMDEDVEIRSLAPLNAYAMSKQLTDEYFEDRGILEKVVGVKYFNVYGAREEHKGRMISMVYRGWQQAKQTGVIKLFESDREDFSNGGQRRDFICVEDVVSATVALASQEQVRGLVNVGSGQSRSWNDLAESIYTALGLPAKIEYFPMPLSLKGKYQYLTEAKIDKMKQVAPTWPNYSLEEGVAKAVKYYEQELT